MAKIKVITDVRIEIERPHIRGGWTMRNPEYLAREMEEWARDFEAFVRDHRSQDPVSLNIIRDYEDRCSHCGYDWEVDAEGCPECCEPAQEEWELERRKEIAA
jgi:hypothetical protein